ncbi:hypothetical protein ACIP6P_25950 [Streptomyces sp. NPDC088729]|uniref:hypothetical protein n=1 Tax=Streptomyces sp. NPDC088729 TaxID=3365876 RepID=UPI0038061DA9
MHTTVVRRTALAACAVSLTLFATACGGSSDADGGTTGKGTAGTGGGSAAKAPAKVLTAAEVEKAALAEGDVKGFRIAKTGPADEVTESGVTIDKKGCLPVAHAMFGVAQKGAVATAKRKVVSEPDKAAEKSAEELAKELAKGDENPFEAALDLTSTFVALASYEKTASPDAFAALKKAAADCAGGFTATVAGSKNVFVSVKEEKATGGDESAAWTVISKADGDSVPYKLTALRVEGTVATFFSFNLAAATGGKDFAAPTEVVAAQAKKLG